MQRRFARHLLSQSNTAFAEMENVVRGSTTQGQRYFAVAVTVSPDASEIKKSQKRVSKDERRSMVEAFVNNYRAINSGNFPTAATVKKEVGGSYYVIKDMVQELQHKSRMPCAGTRNDTTLHAKLYENADVILGIRDTIKNSKVVSKEEHGPHSAMEKKTLSDEIAKMPTMTSETTISLKKDTLANLEEDGPALALHDKSLSDEFATRTLGATVEVKKVELTAQEVEEQTLPLHYENSSEEIAKPSVTDDSSAGTTNNGYLLKEEAKDSYSATRISEDNIREENTSKVDQQQQLSDLANVTSVVGGSYYLTRDMVQELQHKFQMHSTGIKNATTCDDKLHKNADVILDTTVTIKNSDVATREENGPHSAIEEKTFLDEIANVPSISETTMSLEKDILTNPEEDAPTSAPNEKKLSDKFDTKTLEAMVEVKKVELAAQEADEPILPYKNYSEKITKPSATDDSSAETTNGRYLLKEEATDSYSATRISEDNIREKTTKSDQQQQSSDLANVIRDMPGEHEKKPLKWSLKSLADGFMRMWRRS